MTIHVGMDGHCSDASITAVAIADAASIGLVVDRMRMSKMTQMTTSMGMTTSAGISIFSDFLTAP